GVMFSLTAVSYGVMAFRDLQGHGVQGPAAADTGSGLMAFLDRHGAMLLAGEVAVLIAASIAAMATDTFWTRRAKRGAPVERRSKSRGRPEETESQKRRDPPWKSP